MKEENKKELLLEVTIPDFIEEIKLSNHRRPTYFKVGMKLPKKYQDKTKFNYKFLGSNKILYDLETRKAVIKNTKSVGKPKLQLIRGNNLYSGYSTPFLRNEIFRVIKEYFISHFLNINPITVYPLHVEFIVKHKLKVQKNNLRSKQQDLDNFWVLYCKNIIDVMVLNGIIPDDNLLYIQKITKEFIPSDIEGKIMIIKVYKHG